MVRGGEKERIDVSFGFKMFDPQGKITRDTRPNADHLAEVSIGAAPTQALYESVKGDSMSGGMGYPKNNTYWISIIEDPVATLDPKDQRQPRFVLKPTPYLSPSPEIAFIMAAKDIATDADLQRCRVRVGEG